MNWLMVFVGGGLGAGLRHALNRLGQSSGTSFPWWTMAANIAGSFLIGVAAGLFARNAVAEPLRLLLVTGLLGGFTTFSAFSLDAILLWQRGQAGQAALYVLLSVGLALAGLLAGMAAVRLA